METESLLKVSLQLGKKVISDYFRSPSVGLDVALALLKGPQNERSTQFIVKPELWLGVFVIVPGVLMALKQTLSAWESTRVFCRKT